MLQLNNIKKSYTGKIAVQEVSLTIKQGEILGLIGVNGAGKSTTISMIATLIKPDKGEIIFHGENIVKNPSGIRRKLGYVPQEIALYLDLSGMDNLNFWGRAYHIKGEALTGSIAQVMDITGLDKEILKRKVKTYSGGLKRRLNIGVALLHQPKLVVMDEPTAGIDLVSRKKILEAVMQLNKEGATIIYTGHYMEEMEQICSHFCVLEAGKVIASGAKEILLENGAKKLDDFLGNG